MSNNVDQSIKITNEVKLLILCARTRLNPEIKEEITQLIHKDLNWDYLIEISSHHKLKSLLYWNLNLICSDSIPLEVMKKLNDMFHENLRKNLYFLGEIFNILEILQSHNIEAIPYKGPILAINTYGNLSLREFVDIDIFVSKKNILKMKNILISNGYKTQVQLKGFQEKIYLKTQRDYQFFNPINNTNIEIHWNFIGLSFTYPSEIFSNPKELKIIKIQNRNVLSLSSVDMLIVLCIHASGHLWERLSWICDISEFIQSNKDIDWQDLIKKSEKLGFKRILQINILLAVDILDLKLSQEIMDKMDIDEYVRNLCFDIKRNLLNFNETENGILYKSTIRSKIRENRTDQIKDFFKIIISHLIHRLYFIY